MNCYEITSTFRMGKRCPMIDTLVEATTVKEAIQTMNAQNGFNSTPVSVKKLVGSRWVPVPDAEIDSAT